MDLGFWIFTQKTFWQVSQCTIRCLKVITNLLLGVLLALGYSRKNPNSGGWGHGISGGLDWRENMWKFQGSIKKEVEIPGVFKTNSCRISIHGSWFLTSEFCDKCDVTNLKFSGGFSEKYILNPPPPPPLFGFFLEQPIVLLH